MVADGKKPGWADRNRNSGREDGQIKFKFKPAVKVIDAPIKQEWKCCGLIDSAHAVPQRTQEGTPNDEEQILGNRRPLVDCLVYLQSAKHSQPKQCGEIDFWLWMNGESLGWDAGTHPSHNSSHPSDFSGVLCLQSLHCSSA
ncbi:hypothetical protein RvY_18484 [Ramazzottius varieornatus]|uniref:Uncharacterized protein n=1 Tax=Ramazzottius varieornatus TaxID=947166 RepID=A0A1D1W5Y0_RAMVA|nr:hypothetical protein RvY_18484 [Ramazzottius varieornatus]